jgi:hypothetical protein
VRAPARHSPARRCRRRRRSSRIDGACAKRLARDPTDPGVVCAGGHGAGGSGRPTILLPDLPTAARRLKSRPLRGPWTVGAGARRLEGALPPTTRQEPTGSWTADSWHSAGRSRLYRPGPGMAP